MYILLKKIFDSHYKLILFIYALFTPFLIYLAPLFLKPFFGALLVVFAAIAWGLRGGLVSAIWSSVFVFIDFFILKALFWAQLFQGIAVYFTIGIFVGKTIDIIKKQRDNLNKAFNDLNTAQNNLIVTENRYYGLFNNMSSGVIIFTTTDDGETFFINNIYEAAQKIDGIKKEDVINREFNLVFTQKEKTQLLETMQKVYKSGIAIQKNIFIYNNNKRVGWRYIYTYKLLTGELVVLYNDFSEKLKSSEMLQRYQLLYDHTNEIMMFTDRKGNIIDANKAAIKNYGFSKSELLSKNILDICKCCEDCIYTNSSKLKAMIHEVHETEHIRKDGSTFPVEASCDFAVINEEELVLCIIHDITEHKKAIDTIAKLALYDSLTGLPNRKLLLDRLSIALNQLKRSKQKLALLSLDLDNFKSINDTMGHHTGDKLLVEVAGRLSSLVRDSDTVARMGGDEFIILQQNITDMKYSVNLAERIIDSFKTPFLLEGSNYYITTSIGIAIYPLDGRTEQTLQMKSDAAMYQAKESGRNTFRLFSQSDSHITT